MNEVDEFVHVIWCVYIISEDGLCFMDLLNIVNVIIRFVVPVVFNKLIKVECMFLSNTTYFIWLLRCIYVTT